MTTCGTCLSRWHPQCLPEGGDGGDGGGPWTCPLCAREQRPASTSAHGVGEAPGPPAPARGREASPVRRRSLRGDPQRQRAEGLCALAAALGRPRERCAGAESALRPRGEANRRDAPAAAERGAGDKAGGGAGGAGLFEDAAARDAVMRFLRLPRTALEVVAFVRAELARDATLAEGLAALEALAAAGDAGVSRLDAGYGGAHAEALVAQISAAETAPGQAGGDGNAWAGEAGLALFARAASAVFAASPPSQAPAGPAAEPGGASRSLAVRLDAAAPGPAGARRRGRAFKTDRPPSSKKTRRAAAAGGAAGGTGGEPAPDGVVSGGAGARLRGAPADAGRDMPLGDILARLRADWPRPALAPATPAPPPGRQAGRAAAAAVASSSSARQFLRSALGTSPRGAASPAASQQAGGSVRREGGGGRATPRTSLGGGAAGFGGLPAGSAARAPASGGERRRSVSFGPVSIHGAAPHGSSTAVPGRGGARADPGGGGGHGSPSGAGTPGARAGPPGGGAAGAPGGVARLSEEQRQRPRGDARRASGGARPPSRASSPRGPALSGSRRRFSGMGGGSGF